MADKASSYIDRYKKYITADQRNKLRALYAKRQLTTADERREAYLEGRRSVQSAANAASAMGLGQGYINRVRNETDAALDKYGSQLEASTANDFTSDIVTAANATIKAQNEAARAAARRAAAAQKAAQEAAQREYEQALADWRAGRKAANRAAEMQALVDADRAAAHSPYQADTSTPAPAKGRGNDHTAEQAEIAADRNAGIYQSLYNLRNDVSGKDMSFLQPDFSLGSIGEQTFTAEEKALLNDPTAVQNLSEHFTDGLASYNGLMKEVNESYNQYAYLAGIGQQLVGIWQEFADAESIANDTSRSVNERRAASQKMAGLQRQYAQLSSTFNNADVNAAEARYLSAMNTAAEKYDELKHVQALLYEAGKASGDPMIGMGTTTVDSFNRMWQEQGYHVPDPEYTDKANELLDKKSDLHKELWVMIDADAKTSGKRIDNSTVTVPMSPELQAWIHENGYDELFRNADGSYKPLLTESDVLALTEHTGNPRKYARDTIERYLKQYAENTNLYSKGLDLYKSQLEYQVSTPEQIELYAQKGDKRTGLERELRLFNSPINIEPPNGKTHAESVANALGVDKKLVTKYTLEAMTDEEVKFINYLYGLGREDEARTFLYNLTYAANAKRGKEMADAISNYTFAFPIIPETLYMFGTSAYGNIEKLGQLGKKEMVPPSTWEMANSGLMQNMAGRIYDRKTGRGMDKDKAQGRAQDAANFYGSIVQSMGNMAPSIAASYATGGILSGIGGAIGGTTGAALNTAANTVGAVVGATEMGASAAGGAYMDALRQGYSRKQAYTYGAMVGASEAALQYAMNGIARLGTGGAMQKAMDAAVKNMTSAWQKVAAKYGMEMLSEFSEEYLQEILEPMFRNLALDENNKFKPLTKEAFLAGLSGAITAGVMNGLGVSRELSVEKYRMAMTDTLINDFGFTADEAEFMCETQMKIDGKQRVSQADLDRFNDLSLRFTARDSKAVSDTVKGKNFDIVTGKTSFDMQLPTLRDVAAAGAHETYTAEQQKQITAGRTYGTASGISTQLHDTISTTDHRAAIQGMKAGEKATYLADQKATGKAGNLYYTTTDGKAMNPSQLNLRQRQNWYTAQKLAKAFEGNTRIVVHDSLGVDGGYKVNKGKYQEIHLDLSSPTLISTTTAHELWHGVEKANAKAAADILNYLKSQLDSSKLDVKEKNVASKYGITYTLDKNGNKVFEPVKGKTAAEVEALFNSEVAAHIVEDLFKNDTFLDRIIQSSETASRGARATLLTKLRDLLARVKRALRGDPAAFGRLHKMQEKVEDAFKALTKADFSAMEAYSEEADALADEAKAEEQTVSEKETVEEQTEEEAPDRVKPQKQQAPTGEAVKPIAEGSSGEAYYGNKKGQSIEFHYALADVNGVIASHDIYGDENAAYPAELQPRDRSRSRSQAQVRELANNLAPSRLGASSDVQNGAPIVGPDMVVESGNGRMGALQYLASKGKLTDYTAWLKEHASEFGISPDQVTDNSVLVRVRDTDVDRAEFARAANKSTTATFTASEKAQNDAKALPDILHLYHAPEITSTSGDFNTAANREFFAAFVNRIAGTNEAGSMLREDGSLSNEGLERIRNALFELAYGDKSLTERFTEGDDEGLRNIVKAMLNVAPLVAQQKQRAESGDRYAVDIASDLVAAEKFIRGLRIQFDAADLGGKLNAEAYYDTYGDIPKLGEEATPAYLRDLEIAIDNNIRSARKLTALFDGLIRGVERMGDPNQTSMFGEAYDLSTPEAVAEVKENIVKNAIDGMNAQTEMQFRMSEPVEESNGLVAVHNLSAEQLLKSFALGGFPMPSIAVTKAKTGHYRYGDISVIFGKDTIDPQRSRYNKIYGGDAWTPTYPSLGYKPSKTVASRLGKKYGELYQRFGYDKVHPLYEYTYDMEKALSKYNGESGLLEALYKDKDVKNIFLMDTTGKLVEDVYDETTTEMSAEEKKLNEAFIAAVGSDIMNGYQGSIDERRAFAKAHDFAIEKAYVEALQKALGLSEIEALNVAGNTRMTAVIEHARQFTKDNGIRTDRKYNRAATLDAIEKATDETAYKKWVDDLFKGIEEKRGLRNNKNYYTDSGNVRTWDQRHEEETLENAVAIMRGMTDKGSNAIFSQSEMLALGTRNFKNISEVRAHKDQLKHISDEELSAAKTSIVDGFSELMEEMRDRSESNYFIARDRALQAMVDAVRTSRTPQGILNVLRQWRGLHITEDMGQRIVDLLNEVADLPTEYFEAKPQRAVGIDEIKALILPAGKYAEVREKAAENGIPVKDYEADNEQSRIDALNSDDVSEWHWRRSDYSEDEVPLAVQVDTKAIRGAVKTGEATTRDGYTIAVDRGDKDAYTVTVSKDGEVINSRSGVALPDLKGADIERTAAALVRNIKRGRAQSDSTSTGGIYIPKGEMPARDVNVPTAVKKGRKTSKLVRTIAEAAGMTDESVDRMMDKVYDGFMSYVPDINKASMDKALAKLEDDPSGAQVEWSNAIKNERRITPDDIALGAALMISASQSGKIDEAMEYAAQLQDLATTAGKAVQSFRMIKRLGAAGAFYYINRQVAKINNDLRNAAKDYQLVLNQELVAKLLAATDYHDIRDIVEEIRKDLGRQLKPTLSDWLTAWRYTAMLGNLRTLVRNTIGNAGYMPIVMVDNIVNAAIQRGVNLVSGGKFQIKTRLTANKTYRDFAVWDWKDMGKYEVKGNKYNEEKNEIKEYMRYDTGAKGVFKIPAKIFNAWRKGTTFAMEDERALGDMAFKRAHYVHDLAVRLEVQKVDTEALKNVLLRSRNGAVFAKGSEEARLLDIYNAAVEHAMSEANRNTYNDINAYAAFISQMSRRAKEGQTADGKHPLKAAHYLIEGVLPFKNTPANIISRAIEHSPIGLTRTLTLDLGRLIKGKITGEQFIEHISRGITGSGLFVLGTILAKAGILRGALGYDDDEEKDLKRRGHQSYSIEIGDKSISLDWLAPESIPLFMGVEYFNQIKDMDAAIWDEKGLKALLNVATGAFEPMLNMSMLQGVNALFEGFKSKDDLSGVAKTIATIGTSYLTQFQPTLFAQLARTIDPYRRTTYIDKNSKLPPFVSKFFQTALKKIPGASKLLTPYINEWGEKEETGPMWLAALENFLSPAYINNLTETDVDREIDRLFGATAEKGVFPSLPEKYVTYAGERYELTSKEYQEYATVRGTTAYALANSMIGNEWYEGLSDAEKVAAFKCAYEYADTVAASAVLDMRLGDEAPDIDALADAKNRNWVISANAYAELLGNDPSALAQFIALRTHISGMKAEGSIRFGNIEDYTTIKEDGSTSVSWSKMKWDYLRSLNLTDEEFDFLADAFDATKSNAEITQEKAAQAGTTVDEYSDALSVWDEYTKEKEEKKAALTEEEYSEWLKQNSSRFKDYLNGTKLTGEQKLNLMATVNGQYKGWLEKAEKATAKGITYDQAWAAFYQYEHTEGTDDDAKGEIFRDWLDKQKDLTADKKLQLLALTSSDSWLKKAEEAKQQLNLSTDNFWNAMRYYDTHRTYTDSNGVEIARGYQYQTYLNGQSSMTAAQRFRLLEYANASSSWYEKSQEAYKDHGISYEKCWKVAYFARDVTADEAKAKGYKYKKDYIIAFAKSLGLTQAQAEWLQKKFG